MSSTTPHQNLFQFWNTKEIPYEIEQLMRTWEVVPSFSHRIYDTKMAESYIAAHIGSRAHTAFLKCDVPAMQADFFRYCALYHEGGVYIDADTESSGDLASLIADEERGVLMKRQTRVANDFLFFRHLKDPLLNRVIEQAILNIEGRISNNVWLVTGPGIMTNMYQDEAQRPIFDGITFRDVGIVRKIVRFRNDLEYKNSDSDWRQSLDAGSSSIFRDL
ncbi:glycosyltransferase family 32 protein [Oceaniovalibus sp. ACAM 378]|uniref:glycosyltransferase family 32 protein n=1 Tax=Oceaniovalibus sp. ACAM 378 TaxID=2599923 RepID=UPI001651FFE5|nr:glycosyltransferase [Oceaniovalibus sp. ACAM 378]